jgi:hypothetical protein
MSVPNRCGKAWSDEEVQQLLQEVRKKETHSQMASTHQRTIGGIRGRLKQLAADYYFNDNRPIQDIMKFTGLDAESIADAISKKQYELDMKEKKTKEASLAQQKTIPQMMSAEPKKIYMGEVLVEIRDLMKEMLEIMKKN